MLEQFFFGFFVPFFLRPCVGVGGVKRRGAHFKRTRCTLFKLVFYSSTYLFFLLHHQSFNKKK